VETGLPAEAKKMATGFGGGGGLYGDTCGALTGQLSPWEPSTDAPSCRRIRPESGGQERKPAALRQARVIQVIQSDPNKFFEKYGYTLCRDLTSKWHDQWLCRDHALYCREIITEAAVLQRNWR